DRLEHAQARADRHHPAAALHSARHPWRARQPGGALALHRQAAHLRHLHHHRFQRVRRLLRHFGTGAVRAADRHQTSPPLARAADRWHWLHAAERVVDLFAHRLRDGTDRRRLHAVAVARTQETGAAAAAGIADRPCFPAQRGNRALRQHPRGRPAGGHQHRDAIRILGCRLGSLQDASAGRHRLSHLRHHQPVQDGHHNFFLRELVEKGAIGFLITAGLFLAIARACWRCFRDSPHGNLGYALGLGMCAAWVALVIANIWGDRFTYTQMIGYFWVYLALILKAREFAMKERAATADEGAQRPQFVRPRWTRRRDRTAPGQPVETARHG